MDLETENRIAAILLKEAAELRRRVEEEGVRAYLCKPNVRSRPNSRFLTATVLGVQQANKAVEVNEMWRVRKKELELDDRIRGRSREENYCTKRHGSTSDSKSRCRSNAFSETNDSLSCPTKRVIHDCYHMEEDGLRDDEVEEFLHSRFKRGRGAVGSRMDETGPYLSSHPSEKEKQSAVPSLDAWDEGAHSVALGPEKPTSLRSYDSSEEDSIRDRRKKEKKSGSSKEHSKRYRSKEKSKNKDKLKRKEKKRSKHH